MKKYFLLLVIFMNSCSDPVSPGSQSANSLAEIEVIVKQIHEESSYEKFINYADFTNSKISSQKVKNFLSKVLKEYTKVKEIKTVQFKDYDFYEDVDPDLRDLVKPFKWNIEPTHIIQVHFDLPENQKFSLTYGVFSKEGKWKFSCTQPNE